MLRVVLSTCCKHALETVAPNTNISVAILWNLQSTSWSRYCQWQANMSTHPMQHRCVLYCNCVVSRVWPHLRSWVTLLGWCVCHACTQFMHNNGSSFAMGVETNHPYLSAALPTQALPLPPATPIKTISDCPYFAKNHNTTTTLRDFEIIIFTQKQQRWKPGWGSQNHLGEESLEPQLDSTIFTLFSTMCGPGVRATNSQSICGRLDGQAMFRACCNQHTWPHGGTENNALNHVVWICGASKDGIH